MGRTCKTHSNSNRIQTWLSGVFAASSRKRHRLVTAALLTMAVLFLVLKICQNPKVRILNVQTPISFQKVEYRKRETRIATEPPPTAFPKCEQNASVSSMNDFSSLPRSIQDFLFYRHCRHFPLLLDVPDKCGGPENSSDVFLLLVIKSAPANHERRQVLRKTWAAERQQQGVWIRTVFISGTFGEGFERSRLNELLKLENQKYQDILQWDFNDSFYNLTLKQVLFLEWLEQRCPHAHFLFNGDDDVFANTDNMIEYLRGLEHNDGSGHLFVGHLIYNVGPIRHTGSKYYVPVQVHESDEYPPYCGGGGFLLSGFTARTIYNMSHYITLLPIDDVYMGMCLKRAGLKPLSHMGVKTAGLHVPSTKMDPYDPCYYREILLVHRFHPHQIFLMWHQIHQDHLDCGKKSIKIK